MAKLISVSPLAGGWSVQTALIDNPLVFKSGAMAEAAAKRIATAIAMAGEAAQVKIYLQNGVLAGAFCIAPGVMLLQRLA